MIQYLDASLIVALIARQAASALVDPILRNGNDMAMSDFAMAECSSALAKLARIDRWTDATTRAAFSELDAWAELMTKRVEITPSDVATATGFIRQDGLVLRAPDAIHLAAAHRLGATLLTLDRGMAKAAVALGVRYMNPAEAEAHG